MTKKRLDFKVIREDWSEYKVEDGSLVKVKNSISEIIETGRKKGNKKELLFGTNYVFFKEETPDDVGTPSENQTITDEDIDRELKFEIINEPINIYDVPDKFIILQKNTLEKLVRTKKFNLEGKRIYNYTVECAVNVVKYP